MTEDLTPQFDYNALTQETRGVVRQRTIEIKHILRRTAQDLVVFGQKLTEVKEQLGHGNFRNWLLSEFELSLSAATKFMQVYQQFKDVNFTNLNVAVSALYLLAAPSTPTEARHQALVRAQEGEPITYSKAKEIVGYYKSATAQVFREETENLSPQPERTIDVSIQPETRYQDLPSPPMLFRVWIDEVGSIIKLYNAEELEHRGRLAIGTTVKILVGRFSGQMATIQDVLSETEAAFQENASSARDGADIYVSSYRERTTVEEPSFEVSYADVRVAFKGHPEELIDFFERMQSDLAFAKEVFRQTRRITKQ